MEYCVPDVPAVMGDTGKKRSGTLVSQMDEIPLAISSQHGLPSEQFTCFGDQLQAQIVDLSDDVFGLLHLPHQQTSVLAAECPYRLPQTDEDLCRRCVECLDSSTTAVSLLRRGADLNVVPAGVAEDHVGVREQGLQGAVDVLDDVRSLHILSEQSPDHSLSPFLS